MHFYSSDRCLYDMNCYWAIVLDRTELHRLKNPQIPKFGYRNNSVILKFKEITPHLLLFSFSIESASVHADHPGH